MTGPVRFKFGPALSLAAALAVAVAFALIAGCVSEDPNLMGALLPGTSFDSLLVPLRSEQVTAFGNLEIADVLYDENQVLYLGRQGSESSAILARYDFAAFLDTVQAEVVAGNIKQFNLLLYMVNYYNNILRAPDSTKVSKVYIVEELAALLDPSLYPGESQATMVGHLNTSLDTLDAKSPLIIPLNPTKLVTDWVVNPDGHNGIKISEFESVPVDAGLLGFASNEFRFAGSQIEREDDNTVVGVVLQIEFNEAFPEAPFPYFARLSPVVDVGTWDAIDPVPEDVNEGLVLRTHLRSYPYLSFEVTDLPANVLINRAVIGVYNDTTSSYGPLEAIVVSEIDSSFVANLSESLTLDKLEDAVKVLGGQSSVDPTLAGRLEFNVTGSLQRLVNGVLTEPVRYLFTAAEDFFSGYDVFGSPDPDFVLVRYSFFGAGAAEDRRPYLKIYYTRLDEMTGGGS